MNEENVVDSKLRRPNTESMANDSTIKNETLQRFQKRFLL